MRVPPRLFAIALVLPLLAAPVVRADDDDLLSSVYTENGYELKRDERLFALLTAFNVAGFDRAEQSRTLPFPRNLYHPIRLTLRQALAPMTDRLKPAVDLFLDSHPQPVDTYLAAVLALGDEPEFKPTDTFPKELAGLDRMLAEFAKNAKLAKVGRSLATDYRAEFKKLRDVVDGPLAQLRAAYRLKEEDAPPLVLVPMPLDAAGTALARRAPDGSHVIVFGLPATEAKLDVAPLLKAYSQLLAEEATAKVATDGLPEAIEQLKAQNLAAADLTPRALLAQSLRAAVEAKLWSKDAPAETEQAFRRGLLLAREFAKAVEEPADAFPAEKGPWAVQALARLDVKKVSAELLKPTSPKK